MGVKNVLTSALPTAGNTGFGESFVDIGMPRGLFFVPKGKTYTTSDVAALKAALEADILANLPKNRLFPLQNVVNVQDQTEAPVIQTFNTGAKAVVRSGFYDLTLQWEAGGFNVLYAMLAANGRNIPFFIYTDKGLLIGTDAGPNLMKGINPNMVYTFPFTFSDGTKVAEYKINVNFAPEQINQNMAFVDFSSDGGVGYLGGLSGLVNVNVTEAAARALGVLKVHLNTLWDNTDLHNEFAEDLADPSAWIVKNIDTGNPIALTSVADNETVGGWTLTLDTADANYTATANKLSVGLVGPTDLGGLGILGFESNTLIQ